MTTRLVGAILCFGVVACSAAQTPDIPADRYARDLHEEVVHIDVTVKDLYGREETRPMPITIFRPDGEGPFPLVVFNHGRPTTDKRAVQGRSRPETFARYLVAKGFVVLAPTRIGYWETYGDFDPESSGRCNDLHLGAMAQAASDEVLATVAYAKTLPYVDAGRWIVAGQSVGGLTTIATVGRHPAGLLAGINFSGGTGGDPDRHPEEPCSPNRVQQLYALLAGSSTVPMIWFYWPNDQYFGERAPKQWFQAWSDAGGRGTFHTFAAVGSDGHNGINADIDHWLPVVDRFLADLGFAKDAMPVRPPATGSATPALVERLPSRSAAARGAYESFIKAQAPRAFAVGDRGGYGWATGDYAIGKALGYCQSTGQRCRLYAVDDDLVW